jgi:hypothetical protein
MNLEDIPINFVFSRLFRFSPRIAKDGNLLIATSGWRAKLFSLGFGSRKVTIDPQSRAIRIALRRFWLFYHYRRIPFDEVSEVLYGYSDLNPDSVMPLSVYQQNDLFTVGLLLKNGERVTLFRFYGEGDFVNNGIWPDWCYWGDQLEAQITKGNQEDESLTYADIVSHLVGVPIGNPEP